MENYNVKKIVESLFEEIPDIENVNLYLNNSELQRECNKAISDRLNEEFSNRIYDIDGCINFLNNVVSKQIKDKPYITELNIIINTINKYVDKIKDMMYFIDEDKKIELYTEHAELITMLMTISNEFTMKFLPDIDNQLKFAEKYMDKINNNVPLSKDEIEEMIEFNLIGGFITYEEDNSSKAFDYALKSVLESDYKIDEFLYKKLFIASCRNELAKNGIEKVTFLFVHDKDLNYDMDFSWNKRTIRINNESFNESGAIGNYVTFFHEFNHYKQHSEMKDNLTSFLAAKDLYLTNALGEGYYSKNYRNLFFEKNANYEAYKDTYEFVKEKAPGATDKVKDFIYDNLVMQMIMQKDDINKRIVDGKEEDISLLFDKTLSKRKDFMDLILGQGIKNSLLAEYDVTGRKRNVFELLEEKDYVNSRGFSSRSEIYNYLLYEEPVTYEYIMSNMELLKSDEIKEKYGKYLDEAKQVLKQKLIDYDLRVFSSKSKAAYDENNLKTHKYYDSLTRSLEGVKVDGLNQEKETYNKKEDELRISYRWLYDLINEIEYEKVREVENNKSK